MSLDRDYRVEGGIHYDLLDNIPSGTRLIVSVVYLCEKLYCCAPLFVASFGLSYIYHAASTDSFTGWWTKTYAPTASGGICPEVITLKKRVFKIFICDAIEF